MAQTALLVGGSSMVAQAARRPLEAAGFHILTAGRRAEDDLAFDLLGACVEAAPPADVVIHCAASFEGDSADGPLINTRTNSAGALLVADLARQAGARQLIYVSSTSALEHPDNEAVGSYGLSKRLGGENLAAACRDAGIALATLYPSQIVDCAGASRRRQPFFWMTIDSVAAGKDVTIYGRRDPPRNFVLLDDVAAAIAAAARRGGDGAFYCTGPDRLTVSDFVRLAQKTYGRGGTLRWAEDKPDLKSIYAPDGAASWAALGLTPTPLRDILASIAGAEAA